MATTEPTSAQAGVEARGAARSEPPSPAPEMKWWGWGDPHHEVDPPAAALAALREELGAEDRMTRAVGVEAVELPECALATAARARLEAVVGAQWLRTDRRTRILHAAGKSYPDLVRMRSGRPAHAPDAVVYPRDEEQLRVLLDACGEERIAVVPFGGGTSVVGGVDPERGGQAAVIALDLARMAHVSQLDRRSLSASFGPGLRGPALERALAADALTLGHFPQSFEYSSVGGWVATRSAGQASTGYGKIEKLVLGLRIATPSGVVDLRPLPATAAGPGLRELLVGSEGVLGVITEATLKLRPRPSSRRYEGWLFHDFAEGAEALRVVEQHGAAPDVARLLDEEETRITISLAGEPSTAARAGLAYARARGYRGGCLAIAGFEGDRATVARRAGIAGRLLRRAGGLRLGARPGRAWERARFEGPYLRDALMDRGLLVETLETAHEWSSLMDLHAAVRGALANALDARGTPPLVMCHVSHLYPSGASLYFTFVASREDGTEIDQWRAAKSAACDAIQDAGGTITHHHAVGRDHAPWMPREIGERGLGALLAVKRELDPGGIMNPGKLFPGAEAPR